MRYAALLGIVFGTVWFVMWRWVAKYSLLTALALGAFVGISYFLMWAFLYPRMRKRYRR